MGSEYIGIRLTMLDALQQYYKTPGLMMYSDQGKQELLGKYVDEAANRNNLLGDRKAVIGGAWKKLIESKSPEAIQNFVNDPDIKSMDSGMIEKTKDGKTIEIKDKVKDMGVGGATAYMLGNMGTLSPMVTKFETIAQKTGMINYKGYDAKGVAHKELEETLSGQIDKFSREVEKEKGKSIPAPAESKGFSGLIDKLFNNDFSGKVNHKWFHQDKPDAGKEAATPAPKTPIAPPVAVPEQAGPGAIKTTPPPASATPALAK